MNLQMLRIKKPHIILWIGICMSYSASLFTSEEVRKRNRGNIREEKHGIL